MLRLERIEIEGFGPFADRQVLSFPDRPGVVVVYGENMRGKTTLLNAIRYAFFGAVPNRGTRTHNKYRRLHSLTNRELAAQGTFGFSVSLSFIFDGQRYELVRECQTREKAPLQDSDYQQTVLLRRGSVILGPQERDAALARIFPNEISRFFLFDGELLQEYEELLINESEAGTQIANAIERILGVPILKAGRRHLSELADEADQAAAREATRHQDTQALGNALKTAVDQRAAQQGELRRLEGELATLHQEKADLEAKLSADRKYAELLERKEATQAKLSKATEKREETHREVRSAMVVAWRSLLIGKIRELRRTAEDALTETLRSLQRQLQDNALRTAHCEVCGQDLDGSALAHLHTLTKANKDSHRATPQVHAIRLSDLRALREENNAAELRLLVRQLQTHDVEAKAAQDELRDLNAALADADVASVRSTKASYAEIMERIGIVKGGIEGQNRKLLELDKSIERFRQKLRGAQPGGAVDALEARARLFREGAAIFSSAVDEYKADLRQRVETSATKLFLAMTTEQTDYAGLRINAEYGLTIIHKDGTPEEARSAGAEHVVALALMGALQGNAPLRGPIVMDSPFGRLDETHTSNVVSALSLMAEQVILLVYESEVGRDRVRSLLGSHLLAEYELAKINSRRTNIRQVT